MNKPKKLNQMAHLLSKGNGYIERSTVLDLGISARYFYDFVEDQSLVRVGQGLYQTQEAWEDELFEISTLNKKVIFSHETALYLNDLMEREPFEITVTATRGYNATHLRKRKIRVFQVDKQLWNLGQTQLSTPLGHLVLSYKRERAMCDQLKNQAETDRQIFQAAFKNYFSGKDKNIPQLMHYAASLGIEEAMKKYAEVLL